MNTLEFKIRWAVIRITHFLKMKWIRLSAPFKTYARIFYVCVIKNKNTEIYVRLLRYMIQKQRTANLRKFESLKKKYKDDFPFRDFLTFNNN